ncbi:NADH-quinone oxidoreductase subunit K [Sporomusa sp.]|uniref:NADH-quinone oxidoreductase subunit K n=1 Tax=Sporomusa sp. TaxID=2078658 RepID=UPI002C060952|nr:NADH-quinone oxidoreductase subunit K [Sporomusa sp.]HWR41537.1 NADH-quinone oxidoreductase subunit K [Sporomusa sp.]
MNLLIIILLFLALLLSRVTSLKTAVNILLVQSALVALSCAIVAVDTGEAHTYIAAALTLVIKAGLIPYALYRIVSMLRREREDNPILSPNYSVMAAGAMIVLAYGLIDRALPGVVSRDALAAAVAMTLIGLTMIMTRRQAVLQIVGLITMENGLYLVGLSVTTGLPLIIELGVFLDVMVAVVVLVILTYRLKRSFRSTDTSVLKKLKG